jgi:Stage II sporulation protein E (SpoIIE)
MADPWAEVLGELLDAAHELPPDELVAALAGATAALGVRDLAVYLVDLEQTMLLPLADGVDRPALEIEGTLAGRTFIASLPHEGDGGPGRRLWLPLLDGTARLGALALTLDAAEVDEGLRTRCGRLAALVAELLVTKGQYTDAYLLGRRRRELSVAAEMQWQLLPPLTFVTPRVAVAGMLEPAYEVGGDAFDYALNGDVAHIAIVDPVGHDLTASLLASVAIGCYRHSRRARLDLVGIHAAIDRLLAGRFGAERFVTGQLGQLDCVAGRLDWVNAGHPPPLLVRHAQVVGALDCVPAPPLGLGLGHPELASVSLEPGDRVLFYTDGVVEGRNRAGVPFGDERLADLLERETLAGQGPAETMRRLSHAVLAHQDHRLRDDATMVFLEWPKPPERPG